MKKLNALIIVSERYNGHELWVSLGVLQENDIGFKIISDEKIIVDEVTGQVNRVMGTIEEFDIKECKDYDALIVVSGSLKQTAKHYDDVKCQQIVAEMFAKDAVMAAICLSVPTIRIATKGKRVAYFPMIKSTEMLKRHGAIITNKSLEVDGKLVTAEHQMATQWWIESIVSVMKGEDPEVDLQFAFKPQGRLRRNLLKLDDVHE